MKNYIVIFLSILTLAPSFALAEAKLKQIVEDRAKNIIDAVKRNEFPLHTGRKSLILEMQKNPDQLERDIGRFSTIVVGGNLVPQSMLQGKTPEQISLARGQPGKICQPTGCCGRPFREGTPGQVLDYRSSLRFSANFFCPSNYAGL